MDYIYTVVKISSDFPEDTDVYAFCEKQKAEDFIFNLMGREFYDICSDFKKMTDEDRSGMIDDYFSKVGKEINEGDINTNWIESYYIGPISFEIYKTEITY